MKLFEVKQKNLVYNLYRGIHGNLANFARNQLPIPGSNMEGRKGINYWMASIKPNETPEQTLNHYDCTLEDNYATEGPNGILIGTSITVPVINGIRYFPKPFGMTDDEFNGIKREVPLDGRTFYIVSEGPITNYTIIRDYR